MFSTDAFTDVAIGSTRVNGEHKEKVLQRWDGGDSNGESYDLETDSVSLSCTHTHIARTSLNGMFLGLEFYSVFFEEHPNTLS